MREQHSITGSESLSQQAHSAMFAKGNPEADFKRGVIVRGDKALTYAVSALSPLTMTPLLKSASGFPFANIAL